jgi:hypothetical protein
LKDEKHRALDEQLFKELREMFPVIIDEDCLYQGTDEPIKMESSEKVGAGR